MADVKTESKKKDSKSGACPWCSFDNQDERVAEIHSKVSSTVTETIGGRYQCDVCGKNWRKEALNKPWSLELERGAAWAREHRARELRGA